MKFIDNIIDEIREDTENEEFNTAIGLSEETFIRYINEAINRLHGRIISKHPSVFINETEQDVTSGTQEYALPRLTFNNAMISSIEYSHTGNTDDYVPLKPTALRNRKPSMDGDPTHYIRRGNAILLVPTPDDAAGSIRITYVRKPIRLDKRRGIITAVTTSNSTITNLEIDYINGATVDSEELLKRTRFTVVDKYGTIKMDNILLSGITSSASYDAKLTVDSSFTYTSSESIATDYYVVSGDYTTTHLLNTDFPAPLEDYIRQYAIMRVLQRDSSIDQNEASQVIIAMENQIVENFGELNDDIQEIPDINEDWDW
jgi:hypothetical protein